MEKIKLLITSTYKEDGTYNDNKPIPEECGVLNLPQRLLELARKVDGGSEKELVISFPHDDTNTMRVELYNGFRE